MIILTVALWIALCPFWSAEAWWWNYSKKSTSMEPILFSRIINILYLISAINYAVHRRKFLLSSVTTKWKERFDAETKLAFFLETEFHFWRLSHIYKIWDEENGVIDLLSFCILFLHCRPLDVTPENSFFHMSSYARECVRINCEKQTKNSFENITCSEMRKQNEQAKHVY